MVIETKNKRFYIKGIHISKQEMIPGILTCTPEEAGQFAELVGKEVMIKSVIEVLDDAEEVNAEFQPADTKE